MTANKRRKASRLQGSNTHGWGKNQHRGSGTRGGVGNAGRGKKAHCKETQVWGKKYFGKQGFTSRKKTSERAINLREVEDKLPTWIANKKASKTEVNLATIGYTKLLSSGTITTKLKITVPKASKQAEEKIKAAGGELVVNA